MVKVSTCILLSQNDLELKRTEWPYGVCLVKMRWHFMLLNFFVLKLFVHIFYAQERGAKNAICSFKSPWSLIGKGSITLQKINSTLLDCWI